MMKIKLDQFLLGSYLGDAAFVKKSDRHNVYVVFKHSESQHEYLSWKREIALNYNLTDDKHKGIVEVNIKDGSCFPNHQRQFKFATKSSPILNEYKDLTDEEIAERFDEGALAIWILDDGNVYEKRVKISCGSKSKSLALLLTDVMTWKFGLDCYYYEHPSTPSKNYIVIRSNSYDKVFSIISKYIPTNIDVIKNKFKPELKILIKYHSDIYPIETERENSDWIDLRAAEDVELRAGDFKIISLGVSMQLPDGYEALVVPRSSTFKRWGIIQTNHCGVIDNSYCGDNDIWMFPALATRDVVIEKNSRICQFRIQKKMKNVEFEVVDTLNNVDRGGFGISGEL